MCLQNTLNCRGAKLGAKLIREFNLGILMRWIVQLPRTYVGTYGMQVVNAGLAKMKKNVFVSQREIDIVSLLGGPRITL